jgi:hypothetical protein
MRVTLINSKSYEGERRIAPEKIRAVVLVIEMYD